LIPHCGKRIRCRRSAAEVSWKRCVDVFVGGLRVRAMMMMMKMMVVIWKVVMKKMKMMVIY
jgi:hypothetical protein